MDVTAACYVRHVGEDGRTVIVTGGTGSLGRHLVQRFLAHGDVVVVPWIVKSEREECARLWGEAVRAGQVTLVEADVATPEGAQRIHLSAPEVDVLINAAGSFAGGAPVYETSIDHWDDMFRANVRTAVHMSQAVLPGMLRRSQGVILCISSRAATTCPAHIAAYSAAKAALNVFVETLQKELASTDLRINAVAPASLDTPDHRLALHRTDPDLWTTPDQIADTLLYLASPTATAIRGAIIPV